MIITIFNYRDAAKETVLRFECIKPFFSKNDLQKIKDNPLSASEISPQNVIQKACQTINNISRLLSDTVLALSGGWWGSNPRHSEPQSDALTN